MIGDDECVRLHQSQRLLAIFRRCSSFPSVKPFEEIVQFIADAAGAERLCAFRPSPAAERRIAALVSRQKANALTPGEREELQMFVQLDHVMSLAKARARLRSRACATAVA